MEDDSDDVAAMTSFDIKSRKTGADRCTPPSTPSPARRRSRRLVANGLRRGRGDRGHRTSQEMLPDAGRDGRRPAADRTSQQR